MLEEVHGFGSVSGISSELSGPGGGVNYVQGEQFAHITQQLEQRGSQQLSAEIRLNLIAPAAEKRTGRQIANQIFKDFEAVFGATPKSTPLANPAPKKKK